MRINFFVSNSTITLLKIPNINVFFPETAKHPNELFIDFFINKSFNKDKVYHYNVITHSNILVNMAGYLIAEKKLNNKYIKLFIVEEFNNLLFYKVISYDTNGYLSRHYPLNYLDFNYQLINLYKS